jgi:uncharacterized protein YjbI with pentapeptide repeats
MGTVAMMALEIAAGVAGALLLCFGLWFLWLRKYLEWGDLRTLDTKERVGLKIEFVKTAAQIVGGLFFILTILVAYGNYEVSQKNLKATQSKNENDLRLAQEKQVTELYVKAIGELGSDKLPVILGGIYALERIARGSQKDKGPVLEVFCAYVRQNAPWPPEDPAAAQKRRPWTKKGREVANLSKEGKSGAGRPEQAKAEKGEESRPEPDTDIQAMLTVIGRLGPAHDGQGKPQPLDLARTDLRGADLRRAHLERAHLWRAHLEGADLRRAHLEDAYLTLAHLEGANLLDASLKRANLSGAHLERARLWGAHLEGADLWGAHLKGAFLMKAHLEGANLLEAHLEGATLTGAHLEGADLMKAHLEGADLWGAHLKGAFLMKAHLEGADLKTASGLTQAEIDLAFCDDDTVMPRGLKRSAKKKPSP